MAKKESEFWKILKKNLDKFVLIRLESWMNQGIPDVLGVSPQGLYFTAELKVTASNRVSFSPHQIAYHVERENACAFILVLRPSKKYPKKSGLYVYTPEQIEQLMDKGLLVPALLAFDPVDWPLVQESLSKVIVERSLLACHF